MDLKEAADQMRLEFLECLQDCHPAIPDERLRRYERSIESYDRVVRKMARGIKEAKE